jgi:hypothetical protein
MVNQPAKKVGVERENVWLTAASTKASTSSGQ